MTDLLLTRARIDDGELVDIAVTDGTITAVGPGLPGQATEVVDCAGDVVLPGLIESHLHLDKALLDERIPVAPASLADAISTTRALKAAFTPDDVRDRARRVVEMAIANGTTFIRAHCDVDPVVGLTSVDAVVALRAELAGHVDIQVVAFPQEGIAGAPGTERLLWEAFDHGADVVGGCPYSEPDLAGAHAHIDRVFDIAEAHGVPVDLHADFADDVDDPRFALAEHIADATIRRGFAGRVALGHATSLGATGGEARTRILDRLGAAGITVVALPATDMHLGGRSDQANVRRGMAPVGDLLRAGVNVSCSSNNIRNAFTPYGRADLLETGLFLAQTCHLSGATALSHVLDMVTYAAARNVGIAEHYGIAPGRRADLVVVGTKSVADVLLDHPVDRLVIKSGRIVARTVSRSELLIPTR